ncbi:MAG: hypothetical protein LBG50_00275 [Clostridiales Family XIII bacterium]|jgi:hypothetical protein|nr:hypothetical protein [Clostridiales Family XIII bacterium]
MKVIEKNIGRESKNGVAASPRGGRAARLCIAVALSVSVAFAFGFGAAGGPDVYAADYERWEDCDWDGYDDHTGVKVPWVGFDGTRGDTPAGPSPNSQTGKKKAEEEKKKAEEAKKKEAAKKAAEKKKKEAAAKKKAEEAKKKAAAEKAAAEKKEAEAKKTDSAEGSGDSDASESKKAAKTSKASATASAVASEPTETEAIVETETPLSGDIAEAEAVREAAILEAPGEIEVSGAEGGALYAGGKITVKGTGFYGNVAGIEIQLQSTPKTLGTVASDADGSFQASFALPEGAATGSHSIVALYNGAELVRAEVELRPAPANSFWKALSVGLAGGNAELLPGILIFVVLVAIALAALLAGDVRRRRSARAEKAEKSYAYAGK